MRRGTPRDEILCQSAGRNSAVAGTATGEGSAGLINRTYPRPVSAAFAGKYNPEMHGAKACRPCRRTSKRALEKPTGNRNLKNTPWFFQWCIQYLLCFFVSGSSRVVCGIMDVEVVMKKLFFAINKENNGLDLREHMAMENLRPWSG